MIPQKWNENRFVGASFCVDGLAMSSESFPKALGTKLNFIFRCQFHCCWCEEFFFDLRVTLKKKNYESTSHNTRRRTVVGYCFILELGVGFDLKIDFPWTFYGVKRLSEKITWASTLQTPCDVDFILDILDNRYESENYFSSSFLFARRSWRLEKIISFS